MCQGKILTGVKLMLKALSLLITLALSAHVRPSMKSNLGLLDTDGSPMCAAVLVTSTTVLTAAHCVDPQQQLLIRCLGDDIPAQVTKRDADEDLATLKLSFACLAPVAKVASLNPEPGEDVYSVGYPHRSARISKGIVSGYESMDLPPYDGKEHAPKVFLATDVQGDPGSSGGGLFNETGELVGICSMSRGHFMYYSPPQRIRKFLGLQ
jgi:S1-C subfamily serine protease